MAGTRNGRQDRAPFVFGVELRAGKGPAKIEALVVAAVCAAVVAILALVVQLPGALVVHVQDDRKEAVVAARVRCTAPSGEPQYTGLTDGYGEAKWPGLAKGPWRCEVWPPPRFQASPRAGIAAVVARKPAIWTTVVERPAQALVRVVRPEGAARAEVAVRAICAKVEEEEASPSWEARTGLLDGIAILYLPPGRGCRLGLVRPELPRRESGPVARPELSCASLPCTRELRGGVGERIEATLLPTREQWESARPAPEPETPAR